MNYNINIDVLLIKMINHTLIEDIIEMSEEISEKVSIPDNIDRYEYILFF